jgi:hypothetical protein
MRESLIYLPYFSLVLLGFAVGVEYIFRAKGYTPWRKNRETSEIDPPGKFYRQDDTLGFTHCPGRFRFLIHGKISFTSTHKTPGFRTTGNEEESGSAKPSIWILGCSYTYGWLVNDNQSFPWLLQKRIKSSHIQNLGISGYGTLQSLLLLERMLQVWDRPETVILAYAGFHEQRNTFTRRRKKELHCVDRISPFVIPCARLDRNGNLVMRKDRIRYRPFPLSDRSAAIHFLEETFNSFHDKRLRSEAVTRLLLLRMQKLCSDHGIRLIVAGIEESRKTWRMLAFCDAQGIETADIAAPRGEDGGRYTFHPCDGHPNARAHQIFAAKLDDHLENKNDPRAAVTTDFRGARS